MDYQYDELDRLIRVDFADPAKYTEYHYDGSGLRTLMRNPEGAYVTYGYDTAGRLASVTLGETPGDDPTAGYGYDAAGRRTGLSLPNGASTSYSYDGAGRLLSVDNGASSFSYELDNVGNRVAMNMTIAGREYRVDYGYDDLYRLVTEDRKLVPPAGGAGRPVVSKQMFSYDGVGNRLVQLGVNVTGEGKLTFTKHTYNAQNQLVRTWSPGRPNTTYEYDEAGNLVTTTQGALVAEYGFDYRNRMKSYDGPLGGIPLAPPGGSGSAAGPGAAGQNAAPHTAAPGDPREEALPEDMKEILAELPDEYREEFLETQLFVDAAGYETGAKDADVKQDGDKTGAASDDGKADKDEKPENDEKGDEGKGPKSAVAEATSDDEGASQAHGHAPAPEQVHVEYGFYPHHWARHSKTVGEGEDAVTTKFLYDGDNVVAEYGEYEIANVTYVTPFLDQNLSMEIPEGLPGAGVYWYMQDGLGSVRNLADAAGAMKNTYDYTAFGQGFAPGTGETVPNSFTYTSRRADSESGGMYYRFRQYDARVGRFGGRDPIGYRGSIALYQYVSARPVVFVDPSGTVCCCLTAKLTRQTRELATLSGWPGARWTGAVSVEGSRRECDIWLTATVTHTIDGVTRTGRIRNNDPKLGFNMRKLEPLLTDMSDSWNKLDLKANIGVFCVGTDGSRASDKDTYSYSYEHTGMLPERARPASPSPSPGPPAPAAAEPL